MKIINPRCRYCNSKNIDFTGHICPKKKPEDNSISKDKAGEIKHDKKS